MDDKVRWWLPSKRKNDPFHEQARASSLVNETADIENRQRAWHEQALWNAHLYYNRLLPGFNWGMDDDTDAELVPSNLITENLIMSVGDTMASKAISSPVMPTPVPRGASWKTKRLTKKLSKWLRGSWVQLRAEEKAVQAFKDAFTCGIGVLRADHDRDGLCLESVFFDNVIIDNKECANRAAPQTYRIRQAVDRDIVESRYGVQLDNEKVSREYSDYRAKGGGKVVVVEAWRLPDPDGTPGRHVVACCDQLLVDEEWVHDTTPLIFIQWRSPASGFYPDSGVESIVPYQIRHNEINEVIRESQDLMARPRVLLHAGSRVDHQSFDNKIGRILTYQGIKPEVMIWPSVSAELYNERERNIEQCFNFFGLSRMSSQAALPASVRLDSSRAVGEFRAMEDTRFLELWTRYESFRLEIARRMVDAMTWAEGSDHKTSWSSGGKARTEVISWSDVAELQKDHYSWSLEALPLSAVSPAARRDILDTWLAQGRVTSEQANQLDGHPDLEAIHNLMNSSIEDIHRVIELLEDGMYEPPEPIQNLTYGMQAVINNYLLLRQYEDVPDEVFEAHQMWIRAATAITQVGAAPAMTDGAPPEMPMDIYGAVDAAGQMPPPVPGLSAPIPATPTMAAPEAAPVMSTAAPLTALG